MLRQEEKKMSKKEMHVCHSCGIKRDDCRLDMIESLWICATCATGALPLSPACQNKVHSLCKTEACYCDCHPENNEMKNDRP